MQLITVGLGLLWNAAGQLLLGPVGITALAAAATLALLAGLLAGTLASARLLGAACPRAVRDRALRRRAWRAAFLPQRDPDARGRTRPRAPSADRTAVRSAA